MGARSLDLHELDHPVEREKRDRDDAHGVDGRLQFEARLSYGFNRPDAGAPGLESASLKYAAERVWSSIPITSLSETEMPVDNWLDVTLGTDAGIGRVYEGSFDAEGTVMGTATSVRVTFSVCHVANLLQ